MEIANFNRYPLIHIGLMKAGSTFLQGKLFKSKYGYIQPFSIKEFIQPKISACPILRLDNDKLKREIKKIVEKHEMSNQRIVFSYEGLAGNLHSGSVTAKENADKIKLIFPEGKVLLIIREQKSIILSSYYHYLKLGGVKSLNNYLRGFPYSKSIFNSLALHHFNLPQLEYNYLIKYYIDLFGHDNVKVLPLELFKVSPLYFINNILYFSDIKELDHLPEEFSTVSGATLSPTSIKLKRLLNFIMVQSEFYPSPLFGNIGWRYQNILVQNLKRIDYHNLIPKKINKAIKERDQYVINSFLSEYYKESNNSTAELIGFDLRKLGYS